MKLVKTTFVLSTLALVSAAAMGPLTARAAVTDDDKQFLTMAAQSDMNEIKLSQLAETKATNPKVKAFAHKMVTDHQKLEMKMKPYATAWSITPPPGLDSDHQAIYDKLNGLSGADFDKAYIDAMDKDHHTALDAFTKEADTTSDAKFKADVLKGKAVVASHTTMADSLNSKMQG